MSGLKISKSERIVLQRALEIMSSIREDECIDHREGLNLDVVSEISGEEGAEGRNRCVGSGIGSTSENQSDTVSWESSLEIINGGEREGSRSASTSSRNSWGDQHEWWENFYFGSELWGSSVFFV